MAVLLNLLLCPQLLTSTSLFSLSFLAPFPFETPPSFWGKLRGISFGYLFAAAKGLTLTTRIIPRHRFFFSQGCNSRVFRVTLRHPRRNEHAVDLNGACQAPTTLPSSPTTGSGCGIGRSDSLDPSPTPRPSGGGFVTGLMGLGEQFIQGSFGACFSGNGPSSSPDSVEEMEMSEEEMRNRNSNEKGGVGAEAEARCRSPRAGSCRRDTEFALKMALTYRGQDPAQVRVRHIMVRCGAVRCGTCTVRYGMHICGRFDWLHRGACVATCS